MEHHFSEKISERIKRFKIWELIIMLILVAALFGGLVYYAEADRLQFNRMLRTLQGNLAQDGGGTGVRIGAPQGIVPKLQDLIVGCEAMELSVDHPAGDARRHGCRYFLAERAIPDGELQAAGYRFVAKKGDYHLYVTLLQPHEWMITQYGTVSGLQSMCYALVSEQGDFVLLDGGHAVDAENLRQLIEVFGNRVDLWICSHFHEDHIGAITEILADPGLMEIQKIWCPPMDIVTYKTFAKDWDNVDTCERFLQEIAQMEQVERLEGGDVRMQEGLEFTFFSAYSEGSEWTHEGNNCGFIFQVRNDKETMLFCCDVGNDWFSERLIAGHGDKLKSDYVQMGHHGNGGLTEEAYRLVAPKAAFFDGPAWLFEDKERYTAAKNRELMESMGCRIYLMDEAPNAIILR